MDSSPRNNKSARLPDSGMPPPPPAAMLNGMPYMPMPPYPHFPHAGPPSHFGRPPHMGPPPHNGPPHPPMPPLRNAPNIFGHLFPNFGMSTQPPTGTRPIPDTSSPEITHYGTIHNPEKLETVEQKPAQVPQVPPPGTPLSGSSCVYTRCESPETEKESLEVTPITLYKSEVGIESGDLITVNNRYICYPIKNGLIRIINQNSVSRTLLRRHENHCVTELVFFNDQTDLLMSSGTDNHINIWRIIEQMDESGDCKIGKEVVKVIPTKAQRVKWHPRDSTKIAFVRGNAIFITDLSSVGANGAGAEEVESISITCYDNISQVNDICFSASGEHLISVSDDGSAKIYKIGNSSFPSSITCSREFNPLDSVSLSSCQFIGNSDKEGSIIIGSSGNSHISIWSCNGFDHNPIFNQSLKIQDNLSNGTNILKVGDNGEFLFIADHKAPILCVAHISKITNDGITSRSFDNIVEFSLAHPILSMTISYRRQLERGDGGAESRMGPVYNPLEIQLFCIQTMAIQQYHLYADLCYLPHPESITNNEAPEATINSNAASMETALELSSEQLVQAVGAVTREVSGSHETEQSASEQVFSGLVPDIAQHTSDIDEITITEETEVNISHLTPETVENVEETPSYVESGRTSTMNVNELKTMLQIMDQRQTQRERQNILLIERMMKSMRQDINDNFEKRIAQSIRHEMQSTMIPAMSRMVLQSVHGSLQSALKEKIFPIIDEKIGEVLTDTLPQQVNNSMEDLVKKVSENVKDPVKDSFRECFQDVIIPSFQAATQKMFDQIKNTIVKGSSIQSSNNSDAINHQLNELKSSINAIHAKIDTMSTLPTKPISPVLERRMSNLEKHQPKINHFLAANLYEEAFQEALSAQDVEVVVYLCKLLNTREILISRPPQLSQLSLLCLIQQLGTNLDADISIKLEWLREGLLVLDVKDETVCRHVKGVLMALNTVLETVPVEDRDHQYTLIYHVLNSVLSSLE